MQGSVFKDKDWLSPNFPIEQYWSSLPHRERQLEMLQTFYGDILEKKGESFLRICQVIGPSGSGKTCTLRFFSDSFAREARKRGIDLNCIYVNLKLEGGRKVVLYRNLLGKIDPALVSASFSAEEMLRSLISHLQASGKHVLLALDEIDYYVKHFKDEGVVYDLTRLNELTPQRPCGVVGVTFLARDRSFHELLEKAELSTLGRNYIDFSPYTSTEVVDILEKRAREALQPRAYSSEILEFIADVTCSPPINGDLRYALDLLLYSGSLADSQGSDSILPEHVRTVHGKVTPTLTTDDVASLPDDEKLVLLAVVRTLRRKRLSYASLKEIRSATGLVCEEFKVKPIDDVEECLQDLSDRGIVDVKSLTQIGVSGAALENIDAFLNIIIERVRSGADES